MPKSWWDIGGSFDTTSPDVSVRWSKAVGETDTAAYEEKSLQKRQLLPHQINVMRWAAAVTRSWKAGQPPRRGLLAFHNTGAGKTAEMVGITLMSRIYCPDAIVVYVASPTQINNLFKTDIVDEYNQYFPTEMKREAGLPAQMDRGRAVFDRLSGVPKLDFQTRTTTTRGPNIHTDCAFLPEFGYVRGTKCPAVIGMTIGRLGSELEKLEIAQGGRPAWAGSPTRHPVHLEALKVIYIFDEAHNLQRPPPKAGSADYEDRYDRLRRHFLSKGSIRRSFLVMMTATPASTIHDFFGLSKLLVDENAADKIQKIMNNYLQTMELTEPMLNEWASLLVGTVDAWQALRCFALYPRLHFVNTGTANSPLGSLMDSSLMIESSVREMDTKWIEYFMQRHKSGDIHLTDGERKFLTTFNPMYDYGKASTANGSRKNLRRSKGYFNTYIPDYCAENKLQAFSPKLSVLRENLASPAGKQLVSCLDAKSYNISSAICALLESCLGFQRLDLGAAVRLPGKPTAEKMAAAVLKSLRGAPSSRRYFCTRQIQYATSSPDKRRLLWDVVKSVHHGIFNDAANADGALLECVITHETTFNEGVSIKLLRHVHVFDVLPMDSIGQVIGRGQRPGSFRDEKNPDERVMNIYLYPSRWEDAQQIELYRFYSRNIGGVLNRLDGSQQWIKHLKARLLFLKDTPSVHPFIKGQAETATLALDQFLQGETEPPNLPLTGDLILKTVVEFQGVLRMYVALMSVSVNCVSSFKAHQRFGQLPAGLELKYDCRDTAGGDMPPPGDLIINDPVEPPSFLQRLMSKAFRMGAPTVREIASDELIMKGMKDEYGEYASPAAFETFTNIVEDILMTDPWTNRRKKRLGANNNMKYKI